MKKLYEINKEFKSYGIVDSFKTAGIKETVDKIREFVESRKEEILLAWWAEHGFAPGNAVLVEERGPEFKIYVRECTAEEGERAQTAANTARQAPETFAQIAAQMRELASDPCRAGFVPISTETLNGWARQLLPC